MDRAGSPALTYPLSPASSHGDLKREDRDYSVKPPPSLPAYKPSVDDETSEAEIPQLQVANGEPDGLDPLEGDELDPGSFDLVMPADQNGHGGVYELERRSELIFSRRHLQAIFDDPSHLCRFSGFLYQHRPGSVPLLTFYLEALKALRAIEYSNSVLRRLESLTDFEFTHTYQAQPTANQDLQAKADMAFEVLAREDLPMYVTHIWIQTVSVSIKHKIKGTLPHSAEGLAEVFCLTDPSRADNPIVFMSEEFNRTTQYGVDYIIGRNCRFLQGPRTNPFSVSRIRNKLQAGMEHYETFINYRRDGSPFMNLVMLAPLYDSRGVIRYFIGAQVDVSGLARDSYGLDACKRLIDEDEADPESKEPSENEMPDEFTQLAEILGPRELEIVREHGGEMHRPPIQPEPEPRRHERKASTKQGVEQNGETAHHTANGARPRVVLRDPESPHAEDGHHPGPSAASSPLHHNGRLTGIYENYLLVRPYPSLRILFTSPSMRMPGILQSPLLDRIGGSARMRDSLVHALAEGQGVTAKVKWLSVSHRTATYGGRSPRKKMHYSHPLEAHLDAGDDSDSLAEPEPTGRPRWLHCTPLVGSNGKVGVWMIVIVDEDAQPHGLAAQYSRAAIREQRRPMTPASDTYAIVDDGADPQGHPDVADGDGLGIRPRRSSETLGTPPTSTIFKDGNGSATKTIHRQHCFSALRSPPRPLSRGNSSSSARFFDPAALSRASTGQGTGSGNSQDPEQHQWRSGDEKRQGTPNRNDGRTASPLPSWPLPPESRRRREHQVYVPPAIKETSPERGVIRRHSDGETASIRSRSSAFTVRIEEE
ncbi:hypothetical protein HIM_03544 [Hirsutella minnesotensis 3608]|uniref:PAC domain-containing protein n=1 Tax=Hirsutella minnesotensis 3608 TaxID=1043627 RepID=A0A0F7ZVU5_9HYPO|nr:hypothetical protein HIM_03544 [Hirsutella minnesotensis 3608]